MSTLWLGYVWEHSPYKGAARLIHLAIADNANDAGECWPHLPTIIRKANVSQASAYEALKRMQADGHLKYEGSFICRPGREHPLILVAFQNLESPVPNLETAFQNLETEGRDTSLIEPSVEPSVNRSSGVTPVTTEFEYFWTVYPKRVGKGAARLAFSKAIVKTDVETIQKAAERYRDSRAGKDRQYTLNPATWLNQERWDDETPGSATAEEWVDPLGVETPGAPDWYLKLKEKRDG